MAHPRTFRFGLQTSRAASAADWAALARKAEDLGYSSLLLPDHFGDQLSPMPAMMAAADATTDLRVGALVLGNDYRHPVVLAKEIATVDVLSGGRVEFGLGAGWMTSDYEQSGIAHDTAQVRVSRLEEAVTVIKALFTDGPCHFSGNHYTVTDLEGTPKPVQHPHPPILIGGGGRQVLSIAARHAQIVGVNPSLSSGRIDAGSAADTTAAATDRKVDWVRQEAGDRFSELELSCLLFAVVETGDRPGANERLGAVMGIAPDQVADVPHALVGSVDQMCDLLEARRQRWGLSYVVVQTPALETMAPIIARLAGT